ncbi:MAG: N-acetyltransferase [Syntrophaceae bacterium]|nr:N-acetyltransferase [Syntrophaceae bacterium]
MENKEKKANLEISHNEAEGFFFCDVDGHRCVVEHEIKDNGKALDVYRTFVHSDLRGRGIAEELLKAVVCYAAQNGKKVIPSCSYAVTYFRRHKEHQALLADGVDIEENGGSCRISNIKQI